MRKSLVALLLLATSGLAQAQIDLKEGYSDHYTVVRDDTLQGISGKLLHQPWKWPELQHVNLQIQNPHLICPGDTLSLVYVDGQSRLVLNRGEPCGTTKLSPGIRSTPIAKVILITPLDKINGFLLANHIADDEKTFTSALYIVIGNAERIVSSTGDRIYACDEFTDGQPTYGIFHQGKVYIDPKTKGALDINADGIDDGKMVATEGDVVTLALIRTTQEAHLGDRLFSTEERAVNSIFVPSEPSREVEDEVTDTPRDVAQIGQSDIVTLNCGQRDGLVEDNVLAIYKVDGTVCDRVIGESVRIPDERAGLLMMLRTYKKLSYALIPIASRPPSVTDRVQNP